MSEHKLRDLSGLPPKNPKPMQIQQIPIDVTDEQRIACECGCRYFIPVLELYTVSALVSPLGKDTLAQKPALICMECKKPWNPEETKKGDDGDGTLEKII